MQANDINLTVLNTLIAVFETREFTAAADELKISQSTVSKRIAGLETVFGKALFIRRTKGELQPTTLVAPCMPMQHNLYRCGIRPSIT